MPRLIVTIENDADIPQAIAKVQTAISPKSIRVEYGLRLLSAISGFKSLLGITKKPIPPTPAELAAPISPIVNDELPKIIGLTDEEILAISRGESCLRVCGKKPLDICRYELNGAFYALKNAYSYMQMHRKKYDYMQITVQSMREYVPSGIAYLNNACIWDTRLDDLVGWQVLKMVIKKQIPYGLNHWLFLALNKTDPPPLRLPTSYITKIHADTLPLVVGYFDPVKGSVQHVAHTYMSIDQAIVEAKKRQTSGRFSQVIVYKDADSLK